MRVDVLIAAFRNPDLLSLALASVQAQQLGDYRVIVGDDSASDAIRDLVRRLEDPRFEYRRNATPLGPAGNHRSLLAAATSPLAAILNHDDLWAPSFLSRLVQALERADDAVVAFCDHDVIDENGRVLPQVTEECSRRFGRSDLEESVHRPFHRLVSRQAIATACAAVFRRDSIPTGEPADFTGAAYDLWLAYRLASGGGGAVYVRERLASWRFHAGSRGERRDAAGTLDTARCWRGIALDSKESGLARHARRQASQAFGLAALQESAAGEAARARRAAASAFALEPGLKSLAALALARLPAVARWQLRPRVGHAAE